MVKVAQLCPTLCDTTDYMVHGILQARILEWVACPFSRGSSQHIYPTLREDTLLSEPPDKPKNTGVSSLSLLWQIFPTQESNRGLLHCRQILYQLRYMVGWQTFQVCPELFWFWSRKWQPTPLSLPGKFHGQRTLARSAWGCKEPDPTEHTHVLSGFSIESLVSQENPLGQANWDNWLPLEWDD